MYIAIMLMQWSKALLWSVLVVALAVAAIVTILASQPQTQPPVVSQTPVRPKIIVSFPAYDKILAQAFPEAEVVLLTKGISDPHEYQLTPQDLQLLRSLTDKDVVVDTMHASFELKIAEMAQRGEIKAKVIKTPDFETYLTWDGKEVKLTSYGQEQGGVNMHSHGLYPPDVLKLIDAVSSASGLTPNATFVNGLRQLQDKYAGKLSGKAVALTPAAQYILYWLGYRDIAVFIKEPGVPPSQEDVAKALQYAKEGAPVLAAVVSGEALRVVDMFKNKAEEAGINAKVIVADFSKGYLEVLREVAEQIARSQGG
ncbi:ABC transporter substrate-binding protein [Pyrobaculum arsenaticum]|uniref:ABC transporter substrate-binding protein n=2 Tax=Thermoproteaceae TaxID=2267 RepID=A0A7L4P701_9CREN|nr:ABC transporter substrate-binding protein [Pyrobaculum arsenaticum]